MSKKILAIVIVLLLAGMAWLGYDLKQEKAANKDMQELAELDKQEMEKEYQDFAAQYSEMKTYIKNDSIIAQLTAEQERTQKLLEELKRTHASDAAEITRLKKELATVRAVLRSYVIQIDSLNQLNQNLMVENDRVRTELAESNQQNQTLTSEKESLSEKVAIAAQLDATGITLSPLDKKGKPEKKMDAVLGVAGVKKACDFVRFCDAFEIPVLTLTNVKGYCTCECSEKNIAREAAKLTAAFAEATVPKVNVYIGEAFGTAAIVMNSKSVGADYAYAWSNAKIGSMDAKHAAQIMYDGENESTISQKASEYESLQTSAASAAARGYVDTIIEPQDTRKYVIGAFEMLYTKREDRPDKKHGAV